MKKKPQKWEHKTLTRINADGTTVVGLLRDAEKHGWQMCGILELKSGDHVIYVKRPKP